MGKPNNSLNFAKYNLLNIWVGILDMYLKDLGNIIVGISIGVIAAGKI